MTTAAEASAGGKGSNPQMAALLEAGVVTLSGDQEVTFTRYLEVVLPVDKFVFWVLASSIRSGAGVYNGVAYNTTVMDGTGAAPSTVNQMTCKGSIHISTINQQNEADGAVQNQVVFTSLVPIEPLNAIDPGVVWIGEFSLAPGATPVRFAFRESVGHYRQAKLWHYRGNAIYSTMESQIVDDLSQILALEPIVNNSLPIWLANPPQTPQGAPIPVYPSYLVASNVPPPYVAVHIPPESTHALQGRPWIDPNSGSSWQLTEETVTFTTYGLQNNPSIDYQNQLMTLAEDDGCPFGVMEPLPAWQDHKQTQPELGILAQKKTFSMRVSYYQSRALDVALQLIRHAAITFTVPGAYAAQGRDIVVTSSSD